MSREIAIELKKIISKEVVIQELILNYIDCESNNNNDGQDEELFDILETNIRDYLSENDNKRKRLQIIIKTLDNICHFHQKKKKFFDKIEKIILLIKKDMINNFSSEDTILFSFIDLPNVLRFMFKNEMISIRTIAQYIEYFQGTLFFYFFKEIEEIDESFYKSELEINPKMREKIMVEKENFEIFGKKARKGFNDNIIAKMIRKDKQDEFMDYITVNDIRLDSKIPVSFFDIYFQLESETSLIEYAAYYGSIKIYKFLHIQNCKISENKFKYSIIGGNKEIISLSMNNINYKDSICNGALSFHNDLVRFFVVNENGQSSNNLPIFLQQFNLILFSEFIEADSRYLFNKEECSHILLASLNVFLCEIAKFILKKCVFDVNFVQKVKDFH